MEEEPIIDQEDAEKLFRQQPPSPETPTPDITELKESPQEPSTEPIKKPIPVKEMVSEETPQKPTTNWKNILFWAGIVLVAFSVGFSIVNGPALFKKVSYWFNKNLGIEKIFESGIVVSETATKTSEESLPDNRLVIPKIGVDAPVVWQTEESQIKDKLLEGVVHYKTTALPDQKESNVFITGHSSNYWWIKSNYNQIFALLPNLQTGDKIALSYKKVKYVYEVYDKFTVSPKEIEVIKPIEGQSILTLMSCVPIGTNFQRLIIRAKLVYSDQTVSKKEPSAEESKEKTTPAPSSEGEQPIKVTPEEEEKTTEPGKEPESTDQPSLPIIP